MTKSFFFFNDTATTEIYTLSLHDALPIWGSTLTLAGYLDAGGVAGALTRTAEAAYAALGEETRADARPLLVRLADVDDGDRKSTRLNSRHAHISYAVFCLKKKKMRRINSP